jgi:threonine dehydratase
MAFIHPYDDLAIIAGQATLGLELVEDVDDLRRVVIPIGGGGLASGVRHRAEAGDPSITVVGVQVDGCAPYANHRSPEARSPRWPTASRSSDRADHPTLVDAWVDDIVTVGEDDVADAMMFLMERAKLFVEGGGAVGVAALMSERVAPARTGVTAVVLSGGNVDLGVLPGLIRRAETLAGRRLLLFVRITDRPGGLARLLAVISEAKAT